jgi:hypothetical protein
LLGVLYPLIAQKIRRDRRIVIGELGLGEVTVSADQVIPRQAMTQQPVGSLFHVIPSHWQTIQWRANKVKGDRDATLKIAELQGCGIAELQNSILQIEASEGAVTPPSGIVGDLEPLDHCAVSRFLARKTPTFFVQRAERCLYFLAVRPGARLATAARVCCAWKPVLRDAIVNLGALR